MKNKKSLAYLYLSIDWLTAVITWVLFSILRKISENKVFGIPTEASQILYNQHYWIGVIAIPIVWVLFYALVGAYECADECLIQLF